MIMFPFEDVPQMWLAAPFLRFRFHKIVPSPLIKKGPPPFLCLFTGTTTNDFPP
jgi:hypothetical protein